MHQGILFSDVEICLLEYPVRDIFDSDFPLSLGYDTMLPITVKHAIFISVIVALYGRA